MLALTQSVLSTKFLQVQVGAFLAGQPYNPSGDLVQFAFTPLAAPVVNPGSGDWQNGEWETDGGPDYPAPVYWAGILVGPANSGVTLTAGSWSVWVKITDSPEVPVEQPVILIIT